MNEGKVFNYGVHLVSGFETGRWYAYKRQFHTNPDFCNQGVTENVYFTRGYKTARGATKALLRYLKDPAGFVTTNTAYEQKKVDKEK